MGAANSTIFFQQSINFQHFFSASDEMGLWLKGEAKDAKEWEKKRALYNSCFSGTNILTERMKGGKPNKVIKHSFLVLLKTLNCLSFFHIQTF